MNVSLFVGKGEPYDAMLYEYKRSTRVLSITSYAMLVG